MVCGLWSMVQKISYLRHVNLDTLWHEHFSTVSTLLSWRISTRPDTAQKENVALAQISHDTTNGGRLKVALVTNPLADDDAMIAAMQNPRNSCEKWFLTRNCFDKQWLMSIWFLVE